MGTEGQSGLTEDRLVELAAAYNRDGYVVVEDFVDPGTTARLKAEATAIATGDRGAILGADVVHDNGGMGDDALTSVLATI